MKRTLLCIFPLILALAMFLASCGSDQTPATTVPESATATKEPATATVTMTPDLCAPGQIEAEAQKVHSHLREFDDASILASYTPREQLSSAIADLQRIRREAEDEQTPPCLANLKTYQIQHMNSVIDTLIAFFQTGTEQPEGIAIARQQHDQYTLELARVLGLPIITATAIVTPSQTSTP